MYFPYLKHLKSVVYPLAHLSFTAILRYTLFWAPLYRREREDRSPVTQHRRASTRTWTRQCQMKYSLHKIIQYILNRTSGAMCCSNSLTGGIFCFITYKSKQKNLRKDMWVYGIIKSKGKYLFNRKLFKSTILIFQSKENKRKTKLMVFKAKF